MIGNRVIVRLTDGEDIYEIYGTLRSLDAPGAHVYIEDKKEFGKGTMKFFPMARILEIEDRGPIYR